MNKLLRLKDELIAKKQEQIDSLQSHGLSSNLLDTEQDYSPIKQEKKTEVQSSMARGIKPYQSRQRLIND